MKRELDIKRQQTIATQRARHAQLQSEREAGRLLDANDILESTDSYYTVYKTVLILKVIFGVSRVYFFRVLEEF